MKKQFNILTKLTQNYFWDVDLSDWPVMIQEAHLKWSDVSNRLEKEVLKLIEKEG